MIHPVWRDIQPSQFKAMGFDVLMTNSYILYRRKRSEALEKGLHDLIGFEGVLMTDSGGYQVLEYGDTEFTPEEIADFQSKIGSDLAVTLDKPTGYSISRRYARETMGASLRAAEATIEKFDESGTVWVGPIQGGIFGDLVKHSARGLVKAGFRDPRFGEPCGAHGGLPLFAAGRDDNQREEEHALLDAPPPLRGRAPAHTPPLGCAWLRHVRLGQLHALREEGALHDRERDAAA